MLYRDTVAVDFTSRTERIYTCVNKMKSFSVVTKNGTYNVP